MVCFGDGMDRRFQLMATLGVRHISTYKVRLEDAIAEGRPIRDPTGQALSGSRQYKTEQFLLVKNIP